MRSSRGKSETVYSLRLERERFERLREIAALEHRTVASKLRQMVDVEIATHEERAA